MADLDGMSVEELKAKVQELLAQKEEDARTIADLKGQLGMPLEAAESPTPAMSSERKTQMELEAEMEKQQQEMYDQMLTDGTLTQEEYDDMMERKEREKEQKAQEQKQKAAWDEAKAVWNDKGCKKGSAAIEKGWVDINGKGEPFSAAGLAQLFREQAGEPPDKLDLKEVGEFLAGGKPLMAATRNAFIDTFDFTRNTFVQAMRAFLGSFRMPGESMLIERLMVVFARRYYECNPDYVETLTQEKTRELKDAFDAYTKEAEEKGEKVTLNDLGPLVRSLGGDLQWMKDDEIEEMTGITAGELTYVRNLYYKSVGIPAPTMEAAEMDLLMKQITVSAHAARKKSAAAKVVTKLAEVEKDLGNVGEKYAADDPKLPLETERLTEQVAMLKKDIVSSQAEADEAEAEKQKEAADLQLDLIVFLTMMGHKMGNDTAFVLSYSAIMLNTDAHNPRLTGQARMTKAVFIESNRRTPDLANLSDMFMGGVYDEIVQKEIEIDDGTEVEAPKKTDASASPRVVNTAPSFDIIGQRMYEVQQKGIAKAPKRVKIGVTQMGVTVFEMTDVPVTNIIYETMNAFQPDKKERGVTINMKPKGTIYLKTADCKDICAEMTRNKEMLQATAAMKTSSSTENLPAAAAEEESDATPKAPAGMDVAQPDAAPGPPATEPEPDPAAAAEPKAAGGAEEGVPPVAAEPSSPAVRPPRDDEEQI